MTNSVTSKMTKDEMVTVLVILMDIPKTAESGFRTSISKLPQTVLTMMYDSWVRASNVCEVAKKETKFSKEHLAVAEGRIRSLERDLARTQKKLKELNKTQKIALLR